MTDVALVRFVDDQRGQVRWLLSQLVNFESQSALSQRVFLTAAVRAMHNALTGYFAECTQKRYQPHTWFSLLGAAGSFTAMREAAPCEAHLVASWLAQEADAASPLSAVLAVLASVGVPESSQYRSPLLADTSLSELTAKPDSLIASSSGGEVFVGPELSCSWAELDALMLYERSQALEC